MEAPEGNGNPLGNGLGRARPARPIGLGDAPNRHQQRQGIVPPPVQNHNFEIKLGMINLVQNKMFHGLPCEDPIDHLDEFDRLCDLTKLNGVSEDAIKLRLFPMSLGEKAHQWDKGLPPGSITTWDDCKKAFLAKFFSTGRTAKLRSEISSFTQRQNETFSEAWERFKGYTSQCPHHGFNNESLLSTLYRGALPRYREMLDTASNGNFLNQDVEDGWQLVENIANSNGSYGDEYDRSNRSSTSNSIESDEKIRKEVKALNEKLDKLILAQSTLKKVSFVSSEDMVQVQDGEEPQFAEVCYMSNGQGGYTKGYYNYKNNPNLSYRNPDVANPQDQVYPSQNPARSSQQPQQGFVPNGNNRGPNGTFPGQQMLIPPGFPHQPPPPAPTAEHELRTMMNKLLQGQANGTMETSKKLAEINSKIESLNTRVYSLENIASSSAAARQGQLPGKAIQNPKEQCKVIFTHQDTPNEEDDTSMVIEEFCMLLYDEDAAHLEEFDVAEAPGDLHDELEVPTSPVELAHQARAAARSSRMDFPTRSSPSVRTPYQVLLDPYEPYDPTTTRLIHHGEVEVIHKFRRDMHNIGVELPDMRTINEAFDQMKLIKDVLNNKEKVSEILELAKAKQHLLTSPIYLPKLEDQGKFTLPCKLGHIEMDDALVDSGATVNLISLTMAKELSISNTLQRPRTSIMFGDATSKTPLGIYMNYPLQIGACSIPIDLTVMEMEDERDVPLILGTPFLSTVGASIDFHNKEVILHNVNSMVSYRLETRSIDFCGAIENTPLPSKREDSAKLVTKRIEKEQRPEKSSRPDKPRAEKPRSERERVEKQRTDRLVRAPCVLDEESLQALFDEPLGRAQKEGEDAASKAQPGDKRKDPPDQVSSAKPPQSQTQLTMTLHPILFDNGKVEYKIRYKGRSRPFSRARALVTSEQSRDPVKMKELLSTVLTITLDGGTSSTNA